ncbi:uncharacterized protein LOC122304769 [Carya illinoinensis]|uniref:uncharacterized protein LOC122304769 n=1 Tax=Carya illinoinensis TaxID=32201 RepID=UPI001C7216C3|nr:uncharacterized protein LOC122304769 [Carya illinoinensis]
MINVGPQIDTEMVTTRGDMFQVETEDYQASQPSLLEITAHRRDSWKLLNFLKPREGLAWLCFGDFNEILHLHKKQGGAVRPYHQMEEFSRSLIECGLSDMGFEGNKFTWCNNREGPFFTKERLDRALGNLELTLNFSECRIQALAAQSSDHSPLVMHLKQGGRRYISNGNGKERIFRYEASWKMHEDCNTIVTNCWSPQLHQRGLHMWWSQQCLRKCKEGLVKWSNTILIQQRKVIQSKLAQLAILQEDNTGADNSTIRELQRELDKLLEEENVKWKQRAKQAWLKNGDSNSKFFHRCANQRRKTNEINCLVREDGSLSRDLEEISECFGNYYQSLFTLDDPVGIDGCIARLDRKVDRNMNSLLDADFSAGEVKEALFQMNPLRSPGPDGFPAEFYQAHWNIVGDKVTQAVLEVLNSGGDISGINQTFIVLIPKAKGPKTVKDFRPISLCNLLYKVVSKVLSNRLKLILPLIVSQTQSAFVPGRMILDNVIVAFETMHSMSIRGGRQQSHMAINLDMSKAYDRVEWVFLQAVMVKLGFSEKWIRLVMGCVTSVSYSLLLNGSSQGFFKPSRGIRQGDPLSPYLFLLVSEVLSSLLNHAERNRRIHGFPIGRGQININHLLFADDCLLFCRAKAEEWATIKYLLSIYEGASGQKINKDKTSIYFSANTKPEAKDYILGLAGTRATKCYERYLGLPSLVGRSRYKAFKNIIDRVKSKVTNWKTKLLSQAGKEVLLKAVIQALPTYSMGVFKLPKVLLMEINKVMNQFWWGKQDKGNKVHWVSWSQMGKSKESGGMGFRDFECFNTALLAKQAWRIIQFLASLASQVLKAKYFRNSSFLQAKLGARPSLIWRSIYSSRALIEKGSIWRIGNGKETKIWKDKWLPQPSCFMVQGHGLINDEEAMVAELINENTKQWDREKILRLLGPSNAAVIQKIHVSTSGARDRLVWLGTKDGGFTVRSGYHLQKELTTVKVFLWRACLESLPTMSNLFKKKIVSSPLCPVCCNSDETTGHILWNCPSAMDVWSYGPKRIQKSSVRAESFFKIIEELRDLCDIQTLGAFAMTARDIWQRRNKLVFEGSFLHPRLLAQRAAHQLEDFKLAQVVPMPDSCLHTNQASIWSPPPEGTVKVNWDVPVSEARDRVGIGLIARHHRGNVIAVKRVAREGCVAPLLAEAMGGLHVAMFASELNLSSVVLEGDSLQVVQGLSLHRERWDSVGLDTKINGTKSMKYHTEKQCLFKNTDKSQTTLGWKVDEGSGNGRLVPITFSVEACRQVLTEMIIVDEMPFRVGKFRKAFDCLWKEDGGFLGSIRDDNDEGCEEGSPVVGLMATNMKQKFDKYWENMDNQNMLIYVGIIRDPRYKMRYLDFGLRKMNANDPTKTIDLSWRVKNAFIRMYEAYI